ncbi:MAG TPA: protein translocase subunit SecF [Candidatus Paceibacterota bacterium]|nr:protein translocase subunit SecF [Candidatus Paceibacterota bacterium]
MLPKVYKIMFWVSISLAILAFIAVIAFGLKLGVDFKGGSILELDFQHVPSVAQVQQSLAPKFPDLEITPEAPTGMIIRSNFLTEEQHQQILSVLNSSFPDSGLTEKQFSSVGPTIGNQLEHNSIIAIFVVLLAVIIYIAFVFRKLGRTTSPWAMGMAAIVALIHDVVIPFGVFALLGHYFGIEISGVFVAAALTILGFSVSDTVVIFDRVRENIIRHGAKEGFGKVVHQSVLQTLTRSLNTVFTVLLSLFAIYFFGGESIKYFALALIIGIFLGAYSSIFVASPLLVWWTKRTRHQ